MTLRSSLGERHLESDLTWGSHRQLSESPNPVRGGGGGGGGLITQLIDPADVVLRAHFFVIWLRVSHLAPDRLAALSESVFLMSP